MLNFVLGCWLRTESGVFPSIHEFIHSSLGFVQSSVVTSFEMNSEPTFIPFVEPIRNSTFVIAVYVSAFHDFLC